MSGLSQSEGLSVVCGSTAEPLWSLTIPAVLQAAVAEQGDHEAAVFCSTGQRLSYCQLATQVDQLAAAFLAAGLERGDRVGIWSPNRLEWLLTQFATARIGLVLVTINPAYRLSEVEYALNKVQCKALVVAEQFKGSDYLGMLRTLAPEWEQAGLQAGALSAARLPHLRHVVCLGESCSAGMETFAQFMQRAKPEGVQRLDELSAQLDVHDPINIQFTSGTTGSPKGATLTHHNIVNNARFVTAAMELTARDRLCIPVPLYHCFGMVMGTLGCVTQGACMVFPGEGFEPAATLQAIQQESCTALYGVPTMFVAMLEHPVCADTDFSSLRTGIMAGAPCPVEVMKRVVSTMNMREVTIAYGMTETSPVSFQSAVDDPLDRRVGTVGRIHPHLEVKVVGAEGAIVPHGETGELWTRGYSVMPGYWEDEVRTRDAIDAEGWMRTGDLAVIDGQGYCRIVGRLKDMIIRGGENIYPAEVENFLFTHPQIQQVQVFGVADETYGEAVCAWVVPVDGADLSEQAVVDYCKGQIAHYKIPRYVRLRDSLPMTVTGKPQKFIMRAEMEEELGGAGLEITRD